MKMIVTHALDYNVKDYFAIQIELIMKHLKQEKRDLKS